VAKAVVIATSTGGPRALATLLPQLPDRLGTGTLIVQHMPPGFTRSLASRLDQSSKLNVREAGGGESLDPRVALIAPGGKHLRVATGGRTQLSDEPEIGSLRPRADLTIQDAAQVFGERTLLVVMTGMGNDGLAGAREVKRRGGRILVEAQESCTVYGMPRAIEEAHLADEALPLGELAQAIAEEAAS
jgi:two-component system chemotaxis response regulator CheB